MGEKTTMSVLEGNNFVVSDLRGDIDASPTEALGLIAWDTRFLSRWLLFMMPECAMRVLLVHSGMILSSPIA